MKKLTLILLLFGCSITYSRAQNLVSISPDSAQLGQAFVATITGNNTLFQSSSPQGNLNDVNLRLGNSSNYIPCDFFSIVVADDEHFDVTFTIPAGSPSGVYDLNVSLYDPNGWPGSSISLTLPSAFTIGTIDGYITGNIYDDINGNGIKDVGEQGVQGLSVSINSPNYSINTDSSGNYSFAVPNGSYIVSWTNTINDYKFLRSAQSSYNVTINNNNSSGNDFGVSGGLTTVSPSAALRNQTVQLLVTSADSVFLTTANPYGNITYAQLMSSNSSGYAVSANLSSGAIVPSKDSALLTFTIPNYFPLGFYDLIIGTSAPYNGKHKIKKCMVVAAAQSFVEGKLYFDANANGIYDVGEVGIPDQKVLVQPDNILGFTNSNGDYSVGIFNGSKTVTYINDPHYVLSSSPASYTVNANNNTYSGKDFGFTAGAPFSSGSLYASAWLRCNTTQPISITFNNAGNAALTGVMYFVASPNLIYVSSTPAPSSVSGDTLFWNFSTPAVSGNFTSTVYYNVPAAGSTVSYHAHVDVFNGAAFLFSKDHNVSTLVRCSYDPNDKAVSPEGVQAENYTLMNQELQYKIRFQNTGNDTAYVVRVFDVLDPDLNWNTFRVVESSHPVTTALNMTTGLAIFTFNNIYLVDSTTNEPASNGYVVYSVAVDSGLTDYTPITNTADIYFDANAPVTTNSTHNTMVYVIPVGLNELTPDASQAIVIPNPVRDNAIIKFSNLNNAYVLKIYDTKGAVVMIEKVSSGEAFIEAHKLTTGMYMYELLPIKEGKAYRGKFIVQ